MKKLVVILTSLVLLAASVRASSCGGQQDPTFVKQLDGAVVHFEPGSLCKGYDRAKFLGAINTPPECDPTLQPVDGETRYGPKGSTNNPTCKAWARTLGLPLAPETVCVREADGGNQAGHCALGGDLAVDQDGAECGFIPSVTLEDPRNVDSYKYCTAFLGQIVNGGGVAAASCTAATPIHPSCISTGLAMQANQWLGCGDCQLLNIHVNPPKPQICVQRNGAWRCEEWCQSP
jgi:hypothetical protein